VRSAKFVLAALALARGATAAPAIERVDPRGWWVRHTWNPVQILVAGSGLKGASVASPSSELRVEVRQASDDGRYVFLYLTVGPGARPGTYRFELRDSTGSAGFDFRLDPPAATAGRFQGIAPDDVIYLVVPDRFCNGDPGNDSPAGLGPAADRRLPNAYHGGDFRGIRDRLDYLKDLGVTGIWMLPVYRNSSPKGSPYHGYHAVDFYAVEPRFGTMEELRATVDAAHARGLKVMQDQVANHSGPDHAWVEAPPTPSWFHDLGTLPRLRNNFDIAALADPYARPSRRAVPLRGWFAGHLPDFDQTDPLCSDYLIQNALWWIGMTGVDGVRQDTYPYVDRPFWEKWQAAIDRQFPGFFVVGEITARTPAVLSFFEGGTRRRGVDTRLPALLDFPLYRAIRSVFAAGEPMAQLADVLAQDSLYQRPDRLVPFLGNHDGRRFLSEAKGDVGRLLLAQGFLLTTRGIPHLYYGDEVALGLDDADGRASMRADYPGGFPGDPSDAFTARGRGREAALVFGELRRLLHFRRAHPALRGGSLMQLLVTGNQYAYLRRAAGETVLVVLNRAAGAGTLELAVDDVPLPEGARFRSWIDGEPDVVVSSGKVRFEALKAVNMYWSPR
jgi:glycosidase